MIKKFVLITLLGCFVGNSAVLSQIQNLGISFDTLAPDTDTVFYNDIDTFSFSIINQGNQNLTGNLVLRQQVGILVFDSLSLGVQTLVQGIDFPVSWGDSILPSKYMNPGGITVVVIWPEILFGNPTDSFTKFVFVDTLMGAAPRPDFMKNLRVFPNPATDHFVVSSEPLQGKLDKIYLVNANGIPVANWNAIPEKFEVGQYRRGFYYLVFMLKDGRSYGQKIILE